MSQLVQKMIVCKAEEASPLLPVRVALVSEDGSDYGGGGGDVTVDTLGGATDTGKSLMKASDAEAARAAIGAGTSSFSGSYDDLTEKPSIPAAPSAATTSAAGLVKKAGAVDPVASADAAAAAGETPTKEEFAAVVALLNECKSKLNSLIANEKTAGQMA